MYPVNHLIVRVMKHLELTPQFKQLLVAAGQGDISFSGSKMVPIVEYLDIPYAQTLR